MDPSKNNHHHNPHLGVNKLSKSIRKSPPPPQPPIQSTRPPQPQPQVYNISKNDFRDIVQQLTAATPPRSRDTTPNLPRPTPPPQPHPKPPSMRLQKNRPPPLTPIPRPPHHPPPPYHNPIPIPTNDQHRFSNPHPQLHPRPGPPLPLPGSAWAESPVSAYMRQLEMSLSSDPHRNTAGGPGLLPSPRAAHPPPTSPSAFLNLVSPKSPYPLLSPYPMQSPNFPALSPLPGLGILGPGPAMSMPPQSPSFWFPNSPSGLLSPSGFLPILSPRWRDM